MPLAEDRNFFGVFFSNIKDRIVKKYYYMFWGL